MTVRYLTGLDLGQSQDYTALAVLEQTNTVNERPLGPPAPKDPAQQIWEEATADLRPVRTMYPPPPAMHRYAVRHLERLRLGVSYTDVCERVEKLFAAPPLQGSTLVVDQTGVGRPVVDMLHKTKVKATIVPINITGGLKALPAERGGWSVPKKEMVSVMQLLLQGRRLQIAKTLSNAAVLFKELQNFKVKITAAANETFEAWREGDHDDMVLAVAVAAWHGERGLGRVWVRSVPVN